MFEKTLSERLKRIFDFDKVTFDLPSESREQECLFIDVDSAKNSIKEGVQVSRVTGKIRVFCNTEKLPFGYFSKKIQEADPNDTRDLFFYDIEENSGTFRNISERALSFVFLFNSQYDPDIGTLSEINFFDQVES